MIYQVQSDSTEITTENVTKWIQDFQNNILPHRQKLGDYYDGKNAIIKQGSVEGRPNYSINVNMAKYIIDVATAYTFGVPVKYTTQNPQQEKILEQIKDILKNCSANEIDFQQGGDMSTYGVSYQLVLAPDSKGGIENRIQLKYLDPLQTFYVVDNTILEKPICAVYMYNFTENNQKKTRAYVYDNTTLYVFKGSQGSVATLESKDLHNMGSIPIIQCLNNDDAFSDIEGITDLLDSLSLIISNTTDDLQSIANAILCASGGVLSEENIKSINELKTANLPVGAKLEWIIKNINPQATQQQIDYLIRFIFQISQVADLTDDAFGGNQSGVAMQYKLWGMNQLWITKTTKYEKALYQRLKIILHLLQYHIDSNITLLNDINISFSKNLPTDNSAMLQMVQALKDVVSTRTLLSQISVVEDIDAELEELDKEARKNADMYGFENNGSINEEEEETE